MKIYLVFVLGKVLTIMKQMPSYQFIILSYQVSNCLLLISQKKSLTKHLPNDLFNNECPSMRKLVIQNSRKNEKLCVILLLFFRYLDHCESCYLMKKKV
mmetsp:Transcript_21039/g.47697  ORF Transcript_21039/g.47697 Transcript_21039/m.47697 type:complete len:99 (-) Transcript_21039:175-471(-)